MNITKKKQKNIKKIPKKIPKIEKKKENEYHESYVNVCKRLKTSTKVEVCEYYELCIRHISYRVKHKKKYDTTKGHMTKHTQRGK